MNRDGCERDCCEDVLIRSNPADFRHSSEEMKHFLRNDAYEFTKNLR
jgi:hypothetical protein